MTVTNHTTPTDPPSWRSRCCSPLSRSPSLLVHRVRPHYAPPPNLHLHLLLTAFAGLCVARSLCLHIHIVKDGCGACFHRLACTYLRVLLSCAARSRALCRVRETRRTKTRPLFCLYFAKNFCCVVSLAGTAVVSVTELKTQGVECAACEEIMKVFGVRTRTARHLNTHCCYTRTHESQ